MKKIVLASNNKGKIKEIKEIMKGYNIVSMSEIGFYEDIVEDGKTFEENSMLKIKAIDKYLKQKNLDYCIMADDSGLCVDALNGEPGIYSARYAGEHGNIEACRKKLLQNMEGKTDRKAKFVCAITFKKDNGEILVSIGETFGEITTHEIGTSGFAYDCLFYSYDLKKCFAECTDEEKDSVSHRGRALQNLIKMLNQ